MSTVKKIKMKTFDVRFADNGFLVVTSGFNPYGSDPRKECIYPSAAEVMSAFLATVAENAMIDSENKEIEKE